MATRTKPLKVQASMMRADPHGGGGKPCRPPGTPRWTEHQRVRPVPGTQPCVPHLKTTRYYEGRDRGIFVDVPPFFSDPMYRAMVLEAPRDRHGQLDWSIRPCKTKREYEEAVARLRRVEEIAVDEAIAAEDLPRRDIAEAVRSMPLSVAVDAAIAAEDQARRVEELAAAAGRQADLLVEVIDGNYTLAVEWALLLDPARPDHTGGWTRLARSTEPTIVEVFEWVRVAGGHTMSPGGWTLNDELGVGGLVLSAQTADARADRAPPEEARFAEHARVFPREARFAEHSFVYDICLAKNHRRNSKCIPQNHDSLHTHSARQW